MWCVCAQMLDDQTQKRFLSILFVSGSDFYHFVFESFSQNVKFFVLKNCVWPFQAESFMTPSWKVHDLDLTNEILPCSSAHFVSGFTTSSRVTDPWNAEKTVFKGLENSVFKILVFLHSATPTPQNSKFLPKFIKTFLYFYSKTSPRYFFITFNLSIPWFCFRLLKT